MEKMLDHRVDMVIDEYEKFQLQADTDLLPIDLKVIAQCLGNISVEEREMIPEAAVQVSQSRFNIYLQSNFLDRPGMRFRQRFSFAHEIAHTFFFEIDGDSLKPKRGAPRGNDLESACHECARKLLIPERFLKKQFKNRFEEVTGEDLLRIAKTFEVSMEVVLRRVQNHPALESASMCFALSRLNAIEYTMYPAWLATLLSKPANVSIQSWFKNSKRSIEGWFEFSGLEIEETESGYLAHGKTATISARRLSLSTSMELFEIRMRPRLSTSDS